MAKNCNDVKRVLKLYLILEAKVRMLVEESLADVTYFSLEGEGHALEAAIHRQRPCFIYILPFSDRLGSVLPWHFLQDVEC